ncbi:MAG: hypothetical protein JSV44_12420 [Candidatus Zixiibacteriota bacterium]|nr:MAG: hypothetical protein JSV44_12420 [candidate division Zixibacteria bacterium]
MNGRIWTRSLLVVLMLGCLPAAASDFEIGDIALSSQSWGDQTATFSVKNISPEHKTITALATVDYSNNYLTPSRSTKTVVVLGSETSTIVRLPVIIPGNYGKCSVKIDLYDVIDSLDMPLESQLIQSREISIDFPMAEDLKPIIIEKLHVPNFVEENDYFDNFINRALVFLLHRGKTVDEITTLVNAETDFVKSAITGLVEAGYLAEKENSHTTAFEVIDQEDIRALRSSIDETAGDVVEVISGNLSAYDSTIAAMIADGKLTADPGNVVDPGSVLHHKYPVIIGLLLWDILGREFVNDGKVFNIFENSDPCNAFMGDFMYLVHGTDDDVGKGFYYYIKDKRSEQFHCGITAMPILCDPRYRELGTRNVYVNWSFVKSQAAIFYFYSENKVRGPLSILMDGAMPFVDGLKKIVDETFGSRGEDSGIRGARLWCWNLVVSKVMAQLEQKQILEREGLGLFSFTKTYVPK